MEGSKGDEDEGETGETVGWYGEGEERDWGARNKGVVGRRRGRGWGMGWEIRGRRSEDKPDPGQRLRAADFREEADVEEQGGGG